MAHASHVFVSIRAGGATESVEKKSKLTSTPWPALHFAKKAVLRRFEQRREHKAGTETADMRPKRNAGLGGVGQQRTRQLKCEPKTHNPHRADRQRIENDPQWHNHGDPRARPQKNISRENAGDRAG